MVAQECDSHYVQALVMELYFHYRRRDAEEAVVVVSRHPDMGLAKALVSKPAV